MSNTFFISPLISLKYYIMIQKEKNNPSLNWNKDEINFIKNINILFDYDNELSDQNKTIVSSIVNKITDNIPEYYNVEKDIIFVNQKVANEFTNYNYIYYNLLKLRHYQQVINPFSVDKINISVG